MPLEVKDTRFGTIRYEEGDVIEVTDGLPGFRHLRRFLLIESDELAPLKFLQSLEEPFLSFPLIDPRIVVPDYRADIDETGREGLELEEPKNALVYCIVTLAERPENSTANLRAPLVINTANMRAGQFILQGAEYSVTEPLLRS